MGVQFNGPILLHDAISATANSAAIPVQGYSTVAFQVAGTFVATVTFQGTIDGTNWVSLEAIPSDGTTPVTSATAAGIWIASCAGLAQVRVSTAWTSGTSVTVKSFVSMEAPAFLGGTGTITGTVTVDSELTTADLDTGAGTDTRAVVGLALAASGGAVLGVGETAGADAASNTSNRLAVSSWASIFNGTTWDRLRTAIAAGTSIGATGVAAVSSTLTSGSAFFAPFTASALGDASGGTGFGVAGLMGFNGTNWDRLKAGAVANVSGATGYLNALGVGIYNATAPTVTDGRYNAMQLDVSGQLKTTVGGLVYLSTTPAMSVGSAYVTGDYIGTTTSPQSFTNVVRTSGGSAEIRSITISDKNTNAAVALELWLFSATFTAPTDSAAWSISDADALLCVGVIPITTDRWFASSLNKVYSDNNVGLVVSCAATSLFYALVARGTPTLANGDLTICLGVAQQ